VTVAILVDESSRILIQGITGRVGRGFAERMARYGTPLVAGVTPGKGGESVAGVPVFESVAEARRATGANAALISVPPRGVRDALTEAAVAGVPLIWIYTEHVPVHDTAAMIALARQYGARLVGPNSAGLVSPGKANLSDLNDDYLDPGPVGIVSKSGTLATEVIAGLRERGLGVSTVVCLGGDPLLGLDHADALRLFAADPEPRAVVLVGEIGGGSEIAAARVWAELGPPAKPLVAYIAGQAAPPGKRMGHAGAIVGGRGETAAETIRALAGAGARIARLATDIPALVAEAAPALPTIGGVL
jgi:succinyl-CoA synthetase alpha subunit